MTKKEFISYLKKRISYLERKDLITLITCFACLEQWNNIHGAANHAIKKHDRTTFDWADWYDREEGGGE